MEHANPLAASKTKQDDKQPPPGPLSDDIHPPPTILNIDLVRMLERHLSRDSFKPEKPDAAPDRPGAGAGTGGDKGGEGGGRVSEQGCDSSSSKQQRRLGVPDIGPTRTMHLRMTPMVSNRADS